MPKISERLSARKVESEKRPGYYADGGNLYLRIALSGAKGWIFRFTHGGSTRDMGLGGYPKIGLADARDLAGKGRLAVKQGIDPIERRKTERAAALVAKSVAKAKGLIFKDCARQHISAHEGVVAHSHQALERGAASGSRSGPGCSYESHLPSPSGDATVAPFTQHLVA
jgi:hypothetical protein